MQYNELHLKRHYLIFAVKKSVLYHSKRQQIFGRFSFIIKLITTLFGVTTLALIIKNLGYSYTLFSSALVAVAATLDLILKPSDKSNQFQVLSRSFIDLERAINSVPTKDFTEYNLIEFTNKRLEIESQEPPKLKILDLICHNELTFSMDYSKDYLVDIKGYQKLFAHIIDLNFGSIQDATKTNKED